jgi:hypothetical protein
MLIAEVDDLLTETDDVVERTRHRIALYRRHIEDMEREGRESEGAALVLTRLQRVLVRLQLYRNLLQHDRDVVRFPGSVRNARPAENWSSIKRSERARAGERAASSFRYGWRAQSF